MPSAGLSLRVGAILILAGLLVSTFSASSASITSKVDKKDSSVVSRDKVPTAGASVKMAERVSPSLRESFNPFLLPVPQSSLESIATYAGDCVTPKIDFDLGEIVCARATGVPVTIFSWHVAWPDTVGFIRQTDTAIADDQVTYLYQLPSTPTSVVNGQTVNNTGTWRLNLTRFSGAIRQTARFTVHQPSNPKADVFVQKFSRGGDEPVGTGGSIPFVLVVGNDGPDTAQDVHVVDSLPSGATLLSFTQQSGPACTPVDNNDCTMASLTNGARAEFTAVYTVGGSAGTFETSASVSSTTPDLDNSNDSSSAQFEISGVGGTPTCSLVCPTSPAAVNNEPGQNGAHVSFNPPVTSGTCGDVSTSAISGAFFPIGISTVTASTESGETCTFAVTVNDGEDPTVTCPANITTFESSEGSGSATVSFTVTATDNSGTPGNPAGSATVSCDHPSGSSFNVGAATTVTCHANDDADPDDAVPGNITECSFTVTVNPIIAGCTLTPPAPIVVNSPANACGTIVTFDVTPSATGCGTVTCDHPSGSFFPGGETLVTCTSSPDGASTSFTVTVNDVTLPVPNLATLPTITGDCTATAGIPTPTVIQTPTGPVTIIVMEPPTATDNCGGSIAGATEDPRTYQDPGTFIVHWTYTDASGNTSTQNQTIVVTGDDTSPPTITAPGPVTFNTGPTSTSCGVTIADLDVSLGEAIANDSCSVATVERLGVPAGNVFPVGPTLLTYTATDEAGHQASATQLVTVVDNTLPVLTAAPGPVTLYTGAGATSCGVTVTDLDTTLGTATAHDNCAFTVTRLGLPAGNVFPVGLTTITYKVVDASGNQGATTATQNVTVIDNTPPTITCPANITVYLPLNSTATSMVVNYTAPVGTDNCAGATTTQAGGLASGATFPVGTTTNTFTATDAFNNSASCSFTVTVLYNFTGFFSPVGNPPTLNSVNAGRAIPVKFSLSGNKGLNIFAPDNPYSVSFNCATSDPGVDVVETVTAGGSSLSFGGDQYNYVWKTESSWAGTCRQLVVTLNDGSVHTANFKFR
jgi:uncharacterized repeat protein (TIGR01451 family)